MTRIAFTGDLHVDSYPSHLDPATGLNARLVDYLKTTAWVAEEAARREASVLVVAGDFTERRHPAPWLVSRIRGALSGGPGRQVYLRGNHDGEIAGGSVVSVLDDGYDEGDEIGRSGISTPRLELVAFDVVLACIPFLDRHWMRSRPGWEGKPDAEIYPALREEFMGLARALYADARRDYPDAACVLVCHQTLGGAAMSEKQLAFLGDQALVVDAGALASIGFEAVVAGHLHRHQVVVPGDRPVLYTGAIERVDFGEELETKGFIVADVEPGRFEWQFVETQARRFVTLRDRCYIDLGEVRDAVVRCIDVDPDLDPANLRKLLEESGAFDVGEIRIRRDTSTVAVGGLAETLAPTEALEAYFAEAPDAEPVVERGREILQAVA